MWYTDVPKLYRDSRFQDFWNLPQEQQAGKEIAIRGMYQYAQNQAWLGAKRGIVLAGDFGVGKSHLLWATVRSLGWRNFGVGNYGALWNDVEHNGRGWTARINQAMRFNLCVLEDHWQAPSEGMVKRIACYPGMTILGERLSANKPTILVTSHKNKAEFYRLWREELTSVIDEHTVWIEMGGVSLRPEPKLLPAF